LQNILNTILSSGLFDKIFEVRVVILGEFFEECKKQLYNSFKEKLNIIYKSNNIKLYENMIVHLLQRDSQNEDFKVLYLHTKGVSKCNNGKYYNIKDWVDLMLYYNVEKHHIALDYLKNNDTCGVMFFNGFYKGNFWWANSRYIQKLEPDFIPTYGYAENFITKKASNFISKHVCLYESNIDHYKNNYPRNIYKNKFNVRIITL
tara:strand:- start:4854 stop:5465 length:612 start_codon:yes stop_codon:yes gene_type:complete